MSYARLARGLLLFKSFTGLAVPEFDLIAKEIESSYEEHERKRPSNRKRERAPTYSQRKNLFDASGLLFQTVHCIVRISIQS